MDAGRSRFLCPYISEDQPPVYCGEEWDYIDVRRLAVLTDEEIAEFEKKVSKNYLIKAMGIQECPKCNSMVERINKKDIRVVCPLCTKNEKAPYEFCWHCLHKWKNTLDNSKCGMFWSVLIPCTIMKMYASVTYISRIAQVILKPINNTLLIYNWWLSFSVSHRVLVQFSGSQTQAGCRLDGGVFKLRSLSCFLTISAEIWSLNGKITRLKKCRNKFVCLVYEMRFERALKLNFNVLHTLAYVNSSRQILL